MADPSGYDAGKKVKGRKRHIVVDTLGLMIAAVVHPANIQDRHGARSVLEAAHQRHPTLSRILADAAYKGRATEAEMAAIGDWAFEIVAKTPGIKRFVVLHKRWIVERSFAWMGRCRRLAKDFEHKIRFARAFLILAMIKIMLRRIARHQL